MKYIFPLLIAASSSAADTGHRLDLILLGDEHEVIILQEGQPNHTAEVTLVNSGGSFIFTLYQQDNTESKNYTIEGTCFVGTCEWSVYQ